MNIDSLSALRDKQPAKRPWHPPTLNDLSEGRLLAFDQSLSACGVVLFQKIGGRLSVLAAQTLATPPPPTDIKGRREHDIRRALMLRPVLTAWLGAFVQSPFTLVVHEAVPEGSHIQHVESTLLSALIVQLVCAEAGLKLAEHSSIPARTHKKFTCGNANASKTEHGNAIKKLGASLPIANFELIKNEATRDALSVGLCALRNSDGR